MKFVHYNYKLGRLLHEMSMWSSHLMTPTLLSIMLLSGAQGPPQVGLFLGGLVQAQVDLPWTSQGLLPEAPHGLFPTLQGTPYAWGLVFRSHRIRADLATFKTGYKSRSICIIPPRSRMPTQAQVSSSFTSTIQQSTMQNFHMRQALVHTKACLLNSSPDRLGVRLLNTCVHSCTRKGIPDANIWDLWMTKVLVWC